MSDSNTVPQTSTVQDDLRTWAIVIYILYLAAVISAGAAGLVGVILAYVKRDDARGTLWESHYRNQIEAFWVWLVIFIAGVATAWLLVGIPIIFIAFVYFLFRTVKGLLRALDNKPYV